MLRLFTALDSSQAVTNQLFALKKEMIGVRWLNPQTYHCTLLYIGDANVYLYRQIKQQLKHIHFRPFSIRVNKFEIFNAINNKPHVLVNCKTNQGIDQVTEHIIHDVFFDQPPKTVEASVK